MFIFNDHSIISLEENISNTKLSLPIQTHLKFVANQINRVACELFITLRRSNILDDCSIYISLSRDR